ncbi:MAG: trigger factor [Candidatus Omnitrophica bacterium]|nr:trigger factor [Candidatus Omnitrophota bacterium]
MKTEIKKIDNTKREINIEVSGDIVKNKFEEVFKKISQEAKVPGFRPGHAPRDILEKHYASSVHEQVLKELIPDIYNQAIDKEGLDVIELPQIHEVKLDRASLSFKATVEIAPEIAVKNYKGQKIKYKTISVTPDEIKRNIDTLKESRKIEAVDDNFARGLGYPNLAELEKAVERQIFIQKENQQRQRIETEIMENTLKDVDFKLPASLVSRQLQDLLRQTKIDLSLKGIPRQKIEEQEKELISSLEPEAKRQVKMYLVFAEIAKKENISLDDHMPHQVMEFLLRQADWQAE